MYDYVVLTNTATGQSLSIDHISEFLLGAVDLGTVAGVHHNFKFLNQVGVYTDSTTLEQRPVSISGWVIGESYDRVQDNKSVLSRLINPLHEIAVLVKDKYVLRFKPDSSIRYAVEYQENNEVMCQFLIQGTCSNPMFSLKDAVATYVASIIPKFKFPLVIPKDRGVLLGLREPSLLAKITNPGDIDTGMVIQFTCTSTVVNPSLLDVNTREFIKVNKTMTAGETITVSTEAGNKQIKGVLNGVEQNYFKYRDFGSSWIQMRTGLNVLKYDADNGIDALGVLVSFNPKYLEVE